MKKEKGCLKFMAGVMNFYEDLLADGSLMGSIVPLNTMMFYHDLKMSKSFDAAIFAEYCKSYADNWDTITVDVAKNAFIDFIRKRYEGWCKANEL